MKRFFLFIAAISVLAACTKEPVPAAGDYEASGYSIKVTVDSDVVSIDANGTLTLGKGSQAWICAQYAKNPAYPMTLKASEATASVTKKPDTAIATCTTSKYGENLYIVIEGVSEGSTSAEFEFTTKGLGGGCVIRRAVTINIIAGQVRIIDLGLSVKWASCNVDAANAEDYGSYFTWAGSTAAAAKLGAGWRVPTITEWDELNNECEWTWTTQNGTRGYLVTSKKEGYQSASIFLPAAGWKTDDQQEWVSTRGSYWSSTISSEDSNQACNELIENGNHPSSGFFTVTKACSVRAVIE